VVVRVDLAQSVDERAEKRRPRLRRVLGAADNADLPQHECRPSFHRRPSFEEARGLIALASSCRGVNAEVGKEAILR